MGAVTEIDRAAPAPCIRNRCPNETPGDVQLPCRFDPPASQPRPPGESAALTIGGNPQASAAIPRDVVGQHLRAPGN